MSRALTQTATIIVAGVQDENLLLAAESVIHTVLVLLLAIGKPLRRMQKLLVNLSAEERYNLVLVDDLLDSLIEISRFTVKETNCEVFGPFARAEDEEETKNDGQIVVLLNDLFPRIIGRLGA